MSSSVAPPLPHRPECFTRLQRPFSLTKPTQAVDIIDPELAKEERRRSAERRSAEYRRTHGLPTDPYQHHPNDSGYYGREHSPPREYHHEQHHYGNHLEVSQQPPQVPVHGGGNWSGTSRERLHNYSPERRAAAAAAAAANDYPVHNPYSNASDPYLSEGGGYSTDQYSGHHDYAGGVQRPQPSHAYSPPEVGLAAGYFPNTAYDQRDYDGHYPSTERLVGARQHYPSS